LVDVAADLELADVRHEVAWRHDQRDTAELQRGRRSPANRFSRAPLPMNQPPNADWGSRRADHPRPPRRTAPGCRG
jgi:hypothetical protein